MNSALTPTRQSEFWAGARATIPLEIGGIPFALIFGALATATGLTPLETIAMSAILFAGSAQFIAVKLIAVGASAPVIILTVAVINLRHALYAMSLGTHVKHLPQRWLVPLGFTLTDESFVVTAQRFERDDSPVKHWFFLGANLSMYVTWNIFTIFGIVAGQRIPDPAGWGLDFALDVTFIGMLIPMVRHRPALVAALVAGVTALLAHGLPNQLGLIVAALLGVAARYAAETKFGVSEVDTPSEMSMQ
jgi:4-azaleucine resistance transporter AzlC